MQGHRNGRYSALIQQVAARQGGYITVPQLYDIGVSRDAIKHLVRRGYLIRVFHGVYAVGHVPTASLARAHAPLLAIGDRSALAAWSAVNAYTNAARWVEPFTLITPRNARPCGIRVLHSTRLRRGDIRTRHGLRVVSPALALLQIAPDLSSRRLIRLIDEFRIDHGLTHEDLLDVRRRFSRHAAPLRACLGDLQPEPTRSSWEQEWPGFAERHDLPSYEMNVHVLTVRVDVLFPGRLIVMLDGWHVHGSRHAFEHDREEVAEIMAVTGLPVLRITHRQFHRQPTRWADRMHTVLARTGK